MSVRLMADVWEFGPLDRDETSVLLILANFADDQGGNCFPSIERIARLARCSQRQIQRIIPRLERAGWVVVTRGTGRGNTTQYAIQISKFKGCPSVTLSERVTAQPKRVTSRAIKGDRQRLLKGLTISNHHQPSLTPPTPSAEGEDVTASHAAHEIMRSCNLTDPPTSRRKPIHSAILHALTQYAFEKQVSHYQVASTMMENWHEYQRSASLGLLRWVCGPVKFFSTGLWDGTGWPFDAQKVEAYRASLVGRR